AVRRSENSSSKAKPAPVVNPRSAARPGTTAGQRRPRLSWNLHQLLKFLRGQRLAQVLELDRIGHQLAQSHHTVRNYHLLGIELLAHPPRILDADLGELRVNLRRLVAGIHPIHRLAIGTHEAAIDVRLAVQTLLVGDEHANGVPFHQRQLAGAHDDADVALAQRLHGVGRALATLMPMDSGLVDHRWGQRQHSDNRRNLAASVRAGERLVRTSTWRAPKKSSWRSPDNVVCERVT